MSVESLEKIIRKAVVDAEFREGLFSNPEKVFDEFELTDEERGALTGMDQAGLGVALAEVDAGELEDRISRGNPWN
jgi:hypothetical protein